MERLDNLLRHIKNVRENCELLGERLILKGEEKLGIQLIANGLVHDNSKFYGIEWEYLNDGAKARDKDKDEMFKAAVRHHQLTNSHHPEYHNGIEEMSDIDLIECLCDWKARSNEFGSDLMEWIKDSATEKFKFNTKGRVYKTLKDYGELLLEKRF